MKLEMYDICAIKDAIKTQLDGFKDAGISYIPRPRVVNQASPLGHPHTLSHPREGGEPGELPKPWIPASAEITEKRDALDVLKNQTIGDCQRCTLCAHRTNIVFGEGDPNAKIVFVGEAPGAEEDNQGVPFVGRSGKLLEQMINAMGFDRGQVYFCNIVRCRPPENRDPSREEIAACEPFLKTQLSIIKPKVIVSLGRHACATLLKVTTKVSLLRGNWATYEGIDLMPTFHPAYLLRDPSKKRDAWEDLKKVMDKLGLNQP